MKEEIKKEACDLVNIYKEYVLPITYGDESEAVVCAIQDRKSALSILNKLKIKNMEGELETEILLEAINISKQIEYLETRL